MVCFACGKSMKRGAPCFVMSRLWQVSPDSETLRDVLDAVSSLQVCMSCTAKAGFEELEFRHMPRLVDSEIAGFYVYAQSMAKRLRVGRQHLLGRFNAEREQILRHPGADVAELHETRCARVHRSYFYPRSN